MVKVELKAMKVANFKGIKNLEAKFGHYTQITGDNGTGKSSIYDAYLWCLFGKNFEGKDLPVQPLNKDNEVIHKVDTVVELVLDIDGTEMTVKRIQKEKWSVPRGQLEPILQGNTQERFINDVPYSVRDFDEKLGNVCSVQSWFILSSIAAFMGLKMEDRRQRLQTLTGEISEYEIAKDFPTVIKAFYDGKTVEELIRQTRITRKTAQTDLDQIPARIDQQERLRIVDVDFEALEAEKQQIIQERNAAEESLNTHLAQRPETASNEYPKKLAECNREMALLEQQARDKSDKERREIENTLYAKRSELSRVQHEKSSLINSISRLSNEKAKAVELLTNAKNDWEKQNYEVYKNEIGTVCPTCGQDLPVFKIQEAQEKAISSFNERKLKRLDELVADGTRYKERINAAQKEIDESQTRITDLAAKESALITEIDAVTKTLSEVQKAEDILSANADYVALKKQHEEIMQSMSAQSDGEDRLAEYNTQTKIMQLKVRSFDTQLREIDEKLASEKTNERIDAEKARLEEESKSLAQTVADCDRTEYEIKLFKKRKISIVEDRVSSLFEMVHWKMYEPNLTNDGEKEICQAVINGVPYETQNTATRVNAGIDIINGLSKVMDVRVPLFVDNTESVSEVRASLTQTILLAVVPGQKLTIK